MKRSGGGSCPAPTRASPVEFHGNLHTAGRVGLAAPVAEIGVLQRGAAAQRAKLSPVQQVEGLPAEVQVLLLLERNAPGQGDGLVVAREITYLRVVPRGGAKRGSGLRAKPGCRLEEAVCPGIEFSRVTAGPAAVSTHRRPVCSVEDREADSSSQADGRTVLVILNSDKAPAAQYGGSGTLAAQELLPLPEGQLVHIVHLDHVGLVVRGNRLLQNAVVVVFRPLPWLSPSVNNLESTYDACTVR